MAGWAVFIWNVRAKFEAKQIKEWKLTTAIFAFFIEPMIGGVTTFAFIHCAHFGFFPHPFKDFFKAGIAQLQRFDQLVRESGEYLVRHKLSLRHGVRRIGQDCRDDRRQ